MKTRREFLATMTQAMTMATIPGFAAAGAHTQRIDGHAHVFLRSLKMASVHRYLPHYDAPVGEYLALLHGYDFSHGVIIQPSFLGTDNSYLLSALKDHPRRLRGIVVIDPERDVRSFEKWRRSGCAGIRLNLFGLPDPKLHDPAWQNALRAIHDLDWQVELHVEAGRLPEISPPLIDAGVNIVIDHFGRPDPRLGVEDPGFRYMLSLGRSRRVWVKVSGWYRNGGPRRGERIAFDAMPLLRKSFGLDRLVWGSDWPNTQFRNRENYRSSYNFMRKLLPEDRERATILGVTPSKLYGFA